MATNAVQLRLDLDVADVKTLLGIDGVAYDDLIELFLDAGKQEADAFLNNPFLQMRADSLSLALTGESYLTQDITLALSSDTAYLDHLYVMPPVELPIPAPVKLGVLKYVRWNLTDQGMDPTLLRERTGDIQKDFAKYASVDDLLKDIRGTFWRSFRLDPGTPKPDGY